MSQASAPTFDVTLSQLSPDAKKAGVEYPVTERLGLSSKELRAVLNAAATLAPSVGYPLSPEIRISAAIGKFVVQIKEQRLHFISWASTKSRGGNPTVDQIVAIVGGEVAEAELRHEDAPVAPTPETGGGGKKLVLSVILGVAIVGINIYTFASVRRPPGNFLPKYTLLASGPAGRVLADAVGNYETGGGIGDRRLQIGRDGTVVWIKFGPNRLATEQKTFTVQAADVGGAPSLLTSRQGMINIKDPTTLILFGDTYTRVK